MTAKRLVLVAVGGMETLYLPLKKVVRVGRSTQADLVINDPSISRDHAAIEGGSTGCFLIDKDSLNGTTVNGVAIVRQRLRDGDRVGFGDKEYVLHEIEEEPGIVAPAKGCCSKKDLSRPIATLAVVHKAASEEPELVSDADSWRSLELLTEGNPETVGRSLVEELAGVQDVQRVVLYLQPAIINSEAVWIKAGEEKAKAFFPEEKMQAVLEHGNALALKDGSFVPWPAKDAVEAICLPLANFGFLFLGARDKFSTPVIKKIQAVARALILWLSFKGQDFAKRTALEELSSPIIIGSSDVLQQAVRLSHKAAAADATVLLRGETGTGKELFARLIYEESRRASGPFVVVHCSAIEETLFGSTLFGHEKGSFTGAVGLKRGLFEDANSGTIFLDEIGDLSPTMQLKLLRVLQEGEFMRLGGNKMIKVDVRVIAATNRDLEKAVQENAFREDLYFRIKVLDIWLPPLRQRKQDLQALIQHFLQEIRLKTATPVRSISQAAEEALENYNWPGNVRELGNVLERALVLADGPVLELSDLPPELLAPAKCTAPSLTPIDQRMSSVWSMLSLRNESRKPYALPS